jgi:hypothetical protein
VNVTFEGKNGAYLRGMQHSLNRLLVLATIKIKKTEKNLAVANTLAYFAPLQGTKKKVLYKIDCWVLEFSF